MDVAAVVTPGNQYTFIKSSFSLFHHDLDRGTCETSCIAKLLARMLPSVGRIRGGHKSLGIGNQLARVTVFDGAVMGEHKGRDLSNFA
ncbi:hypothetical protein BA939_19920 [Rhizobium sp. S41]|nr:hypothetical protein BA939_19920 [Rhizobium sp. S41]